MKTAVVPASIGNKFTILSLHKVRSKNKCYKLEHKEIIGNL